MKRAVFIDKDGTLVQDVPYNVDPSRVMFTPNALDGLRLLHEHGYLLVIVTNQPGLALGYFDDKALEALERYLHNELSAAGVALAGFYACPHLPATPSCTCRKPQPGLILRAASELDIALHESWMVGDILNDVEAGRRAGCRAVFMDVGNETEWQRSELRVPDREALTLLDAAQQIVLAQSGDRTRQPGDASFADASLRA